MGRYYDMVKANYNKLRNDESVMRSSIEMWDEHLEEMREPHPDKYWEMMRRTHEMMYGKHFDKAYAEWEVAQMHHKGADGKVYKGEHWTMEETTMVMGRAGNTLPGEVTAGDFYVALNSQWHDYHNVMSKLLPNEAEVDKAIIETAMAFWFKDEDWPGVEKVWVYYRAKNK